MESRLQYIIWTSVYMPEGPEVRIVAEDLNKHISNSKFREVKIVGGPYLDNDGSHFEKFRQTSHALNKLAKNPKFNLRIQKVSNHGKWIYIVIQIKTVHSHSGEWGHKKINHTKKYKDLYLFNHLGMSGNWRKEWTRHTLVELKTSKGTFYFDDARHFGKFEIHDSIETRLNSLGPDVLTSDFTLKEFKTRIQYPKYQNKPIVLILLDQSFVSGVGNIYRSDSLYLAKIHPLRLVSSLASLEIGRLYRAIKYVLNRSYKDHGTTIATYKDIEMSPGSYEPIIYGRQTDSSGRVVQTKKIQGRSIFWVDEVQF